MSKTVNASRGGSLLRRVQLRERSIRVVTCIRRELPSRLRDDDDDDDVSGNCSCREIRLTTIPRIILFLRKASRKSLLLEFTEHRISFVSRSRSFLSKGS